MINLSFIVDRAFILQHVLRSFTPSDDFKRLKHALWKRNRNLYYILAQNIEPLIFSGSFISELKAAAKNSSRDIAFIYRTLIFKKILKETESYASFVEKQWRKNYEASFVHIEDITRLRLSNTKENIKVYISHPKLFRGRAYPKNRAITWAHSEDWKNYSTVYLWHEIMHIITYDYRGDPNIIHALIELACDNELRIRLNKRGKYFKEGKHLVGHKNLLKLEERVLREWTAYLKKRTMNLYQFEKRLRTKLPKKFLTKMSKLDWWAEWY